MREVVFDTETTGLDPRQGDRIVEVGCIELVNYLPTGREFQIYINPGRPVSDPLTLQVDPNRVTSVRVFVTAPAAEETEGSRPASFDIRSGDERQTVRTAFEYGELR